MELVIKKGSFAWYIYDKDKKILSKIKSKRFWGPEKKILDANNETVYTTDIIDEPDSTHDGSYSSRRKYVLYKSGEPIVAASLTYDNKSERPVMALRPPKVYEMLLETPYGVLRVQRQKDNWIAVFRNEQKIGIISPFFRCKQRFFVFYDDYSIAFLTGLCVLVDYMRHEDDLIVV